MILPELETEVESELISNFIEVCVCYKEVDIEASKPHRYNTFMRSIHIMGVRLAKKLFWFGFRSSFAKTNCDFRYGFGSAKLAEAAVFRFVFSLLTIFTVMYC